jgi:hypothetical protein
MCAATIDGEAFTLQELFERWSYDIDYYQREFAWTAEDVRILVDDLISQFIQARKDPRTRQGMRHAEPYFLGPFVYHDVRRGMRFLVDGQQRFTVLHLIFVHLYRQARALERWDTEDKLNRAHAAWGRRLHRLEPNPSTALHVQWIFAQRLAGGSVASIARDLNERGVPCPSAADPDRNQHRDRRTWMLTTVAAILANPRYTGRQVWNRQRTDQDHLDPHGGIARRQQVQRWNPAPHRAISQTVAHPPLVSEHDFIAVQAIHTVPLPRDGAARSYLLAGLVYCGICGRVMDSYWAHHRPAYRRRPSRLRLVRPAHVSTFAHLDLLVDRRYRAQRARRPPGDVAWAPAAARTAEDMGGPWSTKSTNPTVPTNPTRPHRALRRRTGRNAAGSGDSARRRGGPECSS